MHSSLSVGLFPSVDTRKVVSPQYPKWHWFTGETICSFWMLPGDGRHLDGACAWRLILKGAALGIEFHEFGAWSRCLQYGRTCSWPRANVKNDGSV